VKEGWFMAKPLPKDLKFCSKMEFFHAVMKNNKEIPYKIGTDGRKNSADRTVFVELAYRAQFFKFESSEEIPKDFRITATLKHQDLADNLFITVKQVSLRINSLCSPDAGLITKGASRSGKGTEYTFNLDCIFRDVLLKEKNASEEPLEIHNLDDLRTWLVGKDSFDKFKICDLAPLYEYIQSDKLTESEEDVLYDYFPHVFDREGEYKRWKRNGSKRVNLTVVNDD
jgi:hypothetical protein